MEKIGILGGTFNPIHNGHIALAETALKELKLDKVLIIPSGMSYMKSSIEMPDRMIRYEMTALAVKNHDGLEVSNIEVTREGNSYTYETLQILKNDYPDANFIYIIGADTLFSMEKWVKPEVIFEMTTIAVTVRDDFNRDDINNKCLELKKRFNASVILLNAPKVDISSSIIRNRISEGLSVSDLISPDVDSFIKNNKLYNYKE